MSIFSELLPKINDISTVYVNNFNNELQAALQSFQKFEEKFQNQNGRRTREKAQKDKNAILQSIDESEDESKKEAAPTTKTTRRGSKSSSAGSCSSGSERIAAKKRSKHEVEGLDSPAQDKRQKRNASVKAQSIISKQVNVNLTQKLRRENPEDINPPRHSSRSRRQKDDEKENVVPNLPVQIKQEKVSFPLELEPMELDSLPLDVPVKRETNPDDIAMPPPAAPVPKPRKAVPKEKAAEEPVVEENTRRSRRNTRTKKQDAPPPVPLARATRSSSRSARAEPEPVVQSEPAAEGEARPKRTRGRKKLSQTTPDSGNGTQSSQESLPASPAEKPRPKRTRRGQKADKEEPKPVEPEPIVSPKEERPSTEQISSPVLPIKETKSTRNKKDTTQTIIDLDKTKESTKSNTNDKDSANIPTNDKDLANTIEKPSAKDKAAKVKLDKELVKEKVDKIFAKSKLEREIAKAALDKESETKSSDQDTKVDKDIKTKANGLVKGKSLEKLVNGQSIDVADSVALEETRVLNRPAEMDQTMVLQNGVYNHAPVTPTNIQLNETVVLDKTVLLDKPTAAMDATVVLEKAGPPSKAAEDTSLLTEDESHEEIPATPPRKGAPTEQPASAVKEKVQQFEEMASRVTRTKTRAMAKKEEPNEETQTPPDKVSKVVLSSETLSKMNSLIFNGKAPQTSSSACKPRAAVLTKQTSASASKAAALGRWREAADDTHTKEDARRKKEALLEAKREQQKRKREEKMLAAAAARDAAERERRALLEATARERREKQQHAELERGERLKEAERKKQELARKVAETEERRRAEEAARHQRLAEEQRRANELRRKQLEEQEAMKREEARMNKEIEKKHREYLEKQKQKQKVDKMHTPFKTPSTPLSKYPPLPPAYMEDGFQYLDSDEDAEPPARPVPHWCSSKVRRARLVVQSLLKPTLVDRLFSVGVHSPDLAEIFPCMERARLKRTSSAVWHTPPPLPPCRE